MTQNCKFAMLVSLLTIVPAMVMDGSGGDDGSVKF